MELGRQFGELDELQLAEHGGDQQHRVGPHQASVGDVPGVDGEVLAQDRQCRRFSAACRSATEPEKNSSSVSTERHDARRGAETARAAGIQRLGEGALRRGAPLDLGDHRELGSQRQRPPETSGCRRGPGLLDERVERAPIGGGDLTVAGDDPVQVGDRQRREAQAVGDLGDDVVDRHADLLGGVAVTDGDGLVVEPVEVDGDGQRCADLVLPPVPPADRLGLVVLDDVSLAEGLADFVGHRDQRLLARQRQHRHLVRRDPRMQSQDRALLVVDPVLVVRGEEERGHRPGGADRRLDDVRQIALARGLVEVVEFHARVLGVPAEVEVSALGDPFELVEAPREQENSMSAVPEE